MICMEDAGSSLKEHHKGDKSSCNKKKAIKKQAHHSVDRQFSQQCKYSITKESMRY